MLIRIPIGAMINSPQLKRFVVIGTSLLLATIFLLSTSRQNLAAPSIFDWESNPWPLGSLSQNYSNIGNPATEFSFTFTGDTSRMASTSPETNHSINGGLSPPQNSLFIAARFLSNTESITLTLDLSLPAGYVSFQLFDIDGNGASVIDRVAIHGSDSQGQPVTPVLIANNPACVSVSGGVATGLCSVNDNQSDGNITANLGAGIKQIVLNFSNASASPAVVLQNMALHDINFDPMLPTPTSTASLPTYTPSVTPITPSPTPTNTLQPPSTTPTNTSNPSTSTPTGTTPPPTNTPSSTPPGSPTPLPTETPTSATATSTDSPVPPTPASTSVPDSHIYLPLIFKQ